MTARWLAVLCVPAALALAQPTAAPTAATVGDGRGEDYKGYIVSQSWEIGYRFADVDGNRGKYRSDVNFRNGFRLFSGRFAMNSKDGHGKWFDELLFSSQGLGGEPYESANFRIQKNKLYRYDGIWRSNEYYNPALPIALGWHLTDTERHLQDHDFTLFPQSSVLFFAGFSRNTQSGPGLSTAILTDSSGDFIPLAIDIRRSQNEFRYGNEFRVASIRVNWAGAQEWFQEQVPTNSLRSTGAQVERSQPYEGTTPSWRVNLFREQGEKWALNGRGTYSRGYRFYTTQETATGVEQFGITRAFQTLVGGQARRPVITGNLTLSLFPTSKFTIANQTAYHDVRMYGDSEFSQIENGALQQNFVSFQYLGIRNITNATIADYAFRPGLSVRGGYQFAERHIGSMERISQAGFVNEVPGDQTNRLHAGTAGVRMVPFKGLTILLDGELGRVDRAFTPISDRNYHGLSARAQWRTRSMTLGAAAQSNYNFNSVSLSTHSSRSRRYAFDGSWSPKPAFSLEASYAKLHLDTATGLQYFVSFTLTQGQSLFISNVHSTYLGVRFGLKHYADLYLGYSGVFDTGDGRALLGTGVFDRVQTYPMNYQSPLARLSIRLHQKLRLNFGYQYYGYSEDLYPVQNYHANTGYTSLLFTF